MHTTYVEVQEDAIKKEEKKLLELKALCQREVSPPCTSLSKAAFLYTTALKGLTGQKRLCKAHYKSEKTHW